ARPVERYSAHPDVHRRRVFSCGRVAELVGIRRRGPSPAWLVRSGGEVKLARGPGEALPAVDLAQGDLAGREQCPEQHRGGLGAGQDALRLDAPLELLVQALDGVRR